VSRTAQAIRLAAILAVAAAFILFALEGRTQETAPPEGQVPCIASYQPLTPYEYLGWDTCGRVWKLILPLSHRPNPLQPVSSADSVSIRTMGENPDINDPLCVYWNPVTGEYRAIPCPAPGSVTAYDNDPRESR
jgi:hypothetical protein